MKKDYYQWGQPVLKNYIGKRCYDPSFISPYPIPRLSTYTGSHDRQERWAEGD
jgi:hypothetical protein